MMDFFDFDGDGKVSFDEEVLGIMLVMGLIDDGGDGTLAETEYGDDDF